MNKKLLRLSILALIAGVGLFSATSVFAQIITIPGGHPRDKVEILQLEPNRIDSFFDVFWDAGPVRQNGAPMPPIPPGFFDPRSAPFSGDVKFGGEDSGPPDTAVKRSSEMIFVDPLLQQVRIELVQLNLVSCDPVCVLEPETEGPPDDTTVGRLIREKGVDKPKAGDGKDKEKSTDPFEKDREKRRAQDLENVLKKKEK
jgi:hypothetical protein